MHRITLVALCALTGCAADDAARLESPPQTARIVRQIDLPVRDEEASAGPEAAKKRFQSRGLQGWLAADGAWQLRAEVDHGRLRCATYETGIQIGTGDADCTAVTWLTRPAFGSRQTHCNSASRIHSGGGELSLEPDAFGAANCVRVLVRCSGGGC
jgi:hypothetical protein